MNKFLMRVPPQSPALGHGPPSGAAKPRRRAVAALSGGSQTRVRRRDRLRRAAVRVTALVVCHGRACYNWQVDAGAVRAGTCRLRMSFVTGVPICEGCALGGRGTHGVRGRAGAVGRGRRGPAADRLRLHLRLRSAHRVPQRAGPARGGRLPRARERGRGGGVALPRVRAGRPRADRPVCRRRALPGPACVRLPATAPLSHLLMAQQLGTVVYALRSHPLDLVGKDAAVIGQGSAGAFFTFLLKRAGAARVLVSDKSPARLAYSRQVGADLAVDADAVDFRSAVMEATGGRGADVVVEAVGSRDTFPLSLELAAAGATVVWFGLPEDDGGYPFSFGEFFRRRLTAHTKFGAQGEPGLESFRYAVRLIADGALDVAPLLGHMLPIEQVDEAFRIARDRTGNALKVSIKF